MNSRGACSDSRERRPSFDDDDVKPAVIQPCVGRNQRAVAVLTRVGDRDDQRVDPDRDAVGDDRVEFGLVGEQLLRGDFEIAQEAAAHEAVRRKAVCDAGVETDAGDVEEETAVELAGVDAALAAAEGGLESRRLDRAE